MSIGAETSTGHSSQQSVLRGSHPRTLLSLPRLTQRRPGGRRRSSWGRMYLPRRRDICEDTEPTRWGTLHRRTLTNRAGGTARTPNTDPSGEPRRRRVSLRARWGGPRCAGASRSEAMPSDLSASWEGVRRRKKTETLSIRRLARLGRILQPPRCRLRRELR